MIALLASAVPLIVGVVSFVEVSVVVITGCAGAVVSKLILKETDETDAHSLKVIYVAPLLESIKHLKFALTGNNQGDAGSVPKIDQKLLQDVQKEG